MRRVVAWRASEFGKRRGTQENQMRVHQCEPPLHDNQCGSLLRQLPKSPWCGRQLTKPRARWANADDSEPQRSPDLGDAQWTPSELQRATVFREKDHRHADEHHHHRREYTPPGQEPGDVSRFVEQVKEEGGPDPEEDHRDVEAAEIRAEDPYERLQLLILKGAARGGVQLQKHEAEYDRDGANGCLT